MNNKLRQSTSTCVLLCGLFAPFTTTFTTAFATSSNINVTPSDIEELEFLNLLDEQTEIATKLKMNADHVPGIVSVLRGDQLYLSGVSSVWHALATIPGIDVFETELGARSLNVRGIGGQLNTGLVKFLLNGTDITSDSLSLPIALMDMPIELVERIDVIRGPGSSLYGENAYAAVINVTTKTTTRSVSVGVGENSSKQMTANYFWQFDQTDTRVSLNLASTDTNGASLFVGADGITNTGVDIDFPQTFASNAPGNTVESRRFQSAHLHIDRNDNYFKLLTLENKFSPLFGLLFSLPDQRDYIVDETWSAEIGGSADLQEKASATAKIGFRDFDTESLMTILPAGFSLWPNPLNPILPDGFVGNNGYSEHKTYVDLDLFWEASDLHQFTLMVGASNSAVQDSYLNTNLHPNGTPTRLDDYSLAAFERFHFEDGVDIIDGDLSRRIRYIALQDQITLNSTTTLTAGLRYDNYSDAGSNTSLRLATVYQPNDRHILKLQYAEAFRPPTFYEITQSSDLGNQLIEMLDLSYIYKPSWGKHTFTAYKIKTDGIIDFSIFENRFTNLTGDDYFGAEYELKAFVNERLSIDFALSFNDSESGATNRRVDGTTQNLSYLTINYTPSSEWYWSLSGKYVGRKSRELFDPRSDLSSYSMVNLSVNYQPLKWSNLSFQFSLDNLLDEDVLYPSPLGIDVLGTVYPTYPDEFPRDLQVWRLKAKLTL